MQWLGALRFQAYRNGILAIVALLRVKMSFWERLPWRAIGMAHWSEAKVLPGLVAKHMLSNDSWTLTLKKLLLQHHERSGSSPSHWGGCNALYHPS